MNKCDCYCENTKAEARYSPYTGDYIGNINVKYGCCRGTKEQDECSCGGDRTKCDFYPEIREKADRKENMTEVYFINDFFVKTTNWQNAFKAWIQYEGYTSNISDKAIDAMDTVEQIIELMGSLSPTYIQRYGVISELYVSDSCFEPKVYEE